MTLMLGRIVHNRGPFIRHGEVLHINASPAVSFVMIMMRTGDYVGELWWRCYPHLTISATHRTRLKYHFCTWWLKKKKRLASIREWGSHDSWFIHIFYWSLPNSAWTKALKWFYFAEMNLKTVCSLTLALYTNYYYWPIAERCLW